MDSRHRIKRPKALRQTDIGQNAAGAGRRKHHAIRPGSERLHCFKDFHRSI